MVQFASQMEMHTHAYVLNITRESTVSYIQTLAPIVHASTAALARHLEAVHTFAYVDLVTREQHVKHITSATAIRA